jgi:hypothetical protein
MTTNGHWLSTSLLSCLLVGGRRSRCGCSAKSGRKSRFKHLLISSPFPGIHNPGAQCNEIESARVTDSVNKESRRPIYAILNATPKMLVNEILIVPALQLIAEAFDVETNLLSISVQILWSQGILVFE